MGKLILEKESHQIRGAAFEVYKEMGHGFLEAISSEHPGDRQSAATGILQPR